MAELNVLPRLNPTDSQQENEFTPNKKSSPGSPSSNGHQNEMEKDSDMKTERIHSKDRELVILNLEGKKVDPVRRIDRNFFEDYYGKNLPFNEKQYDEIKSIVGEDPVVLVDGKGCFFLAPRAISKVPSNTDATNPLNLGTTPLVEVPEKIKIIVSDKFVRVIAQTKYEYFINASFDKLEELLVSIFGCDAQENKISSSSGEQDTTNKPGWVKITSGSGQEFCIERKAAMVSGTIKSMLNGNPFAESINNEVVFRDIATPILEKVIHYLYYKLKYPISSSDSPEFIIEPEIALELLMAANFLDC